MTIYRKKTITIETRQRVVIRHLRNNSLVAYCNICGFEISMLLPEQAAIFSQMTIEEIYKLIENNVLHSTELFGTLLICSNSLSSHKF